MSSGDDRTMYERLMSWFCLLMLASAVVGIFVILITGVVAKIGGGASP